jgi:hypothetical protein
MSRHWSHGNPAAKHAATQTVRAQKGPSRAALGPVGYDGCLGARSHTELIGITER